MERINIYNEEQFDYEIKKDKNEMNEDTKILKLSSGEEVICNVVNNPEDSFISVVYPMKMQSYPIFTRNGIEESLTLQRWIHFAEEDTFDIDKTNVITMTEASYGLSKF